MREWVHPNAYPAAQVGKRPFLSAEQRVVILCSTFWGLRNAVHSGMLKRLNARGVKVFLLTSKESQSALFDDHNDVEIHPLLDTPLIKRTRGKPFLDAVLNASFARRYQNSSYPVFTSWERHTAQGWLRVRSSLVECLARVGRHDPFYYWQINNLERFIRRTRNYSPVLQQLRSIGPALVIATNSVNSTENHYVRAAQDLGIVTLNWVLSFDNLTSRGRLPLFDLYAVWNQRMRDQVLKLYPERKQSDIYVTGTPQFDFHINSELRWSRELTLRKLGLRGGDRYLLYAANCVQFTPSEPKLVEEFAQRLVADQNLRNHKIVVRLHPLDDFDRWRFTTTLSNVVISKPCDPEKGLALSDQALLANSLVYADVCVNMASTMSLDAAVVDTPIVCVGFAIPFGTSEDRFCRAVYGTEHYRPVVESRGVRLAESMEQLVAEVATYVSQPHRDSAQRQELVRQEVGAVDSRAGERLAALAARISREILLRKMVLVQTCENDV